MNNNGNMYMRTVSATNTKVMVIAKVPVLLVLESWYDDDDESASRTTTTVTATAGYSSSNHDLC